MNMNLPNIKITKKGIIIGAGVAAITMGVIGVSMYIKKRKAVKVENRRFNDFEEQIKRQDREEMENFIKQQEINNQPIQPVQQPVTNPVVEEQPVQPITVNNQVTVDIAAIITSLVQNEEFVKAVAKYIPAPVMQEAIKSTTTATVNNVNNNNNEILQSLTPEQQIEILKYLVSGNNVTMIGGSVNINDIPILKSMTEEQRNNFIKDLTSIKERIGSDLQPKDANYYNNWIKQYKK